LTVIVCEDDDKQGWVRGCRGRGKGDPPEKGNLYIVDAIPFLPVINNG